MYTVFFYEWFYSNTVQKIPPNYIFILHFLFDQTQKQIPINGKTLRKQKAIRSYKKKIKKQEPSTSTEAPNPQKFQFSASTE